MLGMCRWALCWLIAHPKFQRKVRLGRTVPAPQHSSSTVFVDLWWQRPCSFCPQCGFRAHLSAAYQAEQLPEVPGIRAGPMAEPQTPASRVAGACGAMKPAVHVGSQGGFLKEELLLVLGALGYGP